MTKRRRLFRQFKSTCGSLEALRGDKTASRDCSHAQGFIRLQVTTSETRPLTATECFWHTGGVKTTKQEVNRRPPRRLASWRVDKRFFLSPRAEAMSPFRTIAIRYSNGTALVSGLTNPSVSCSRPAIIRLYCTRVGVNTETQELG